MTISKVTIGIFAALTAMTQLHATSVCAQPVVAEGAVRKALLDTLRTAVAAELGNPIVFVVEKASVEGDWAFILATPKRTASQSIDWSKTVCSGDVSHLVGALMKRKAGNWVVEAMALCPTDVAWETWPKDYGAPPAIFE